MSFAAKAETWPSRYELTAALLQRVFERPLQLSQLESAIVISRVAHPALDTTGRQVGEASVFPPALRLDVVTEWQTCPYFESRFEAPVPMNVSALKLVAQQWTKVLSLAACVRSSFMSRMGLPPGRLSLLDLYVLSVTTLALPAYAMVRNETPIPNGALPPLLALLFKVVDGVRRHHRRCSFLQRLSPTRGTALRRA
ncbi:MAG: hypothetical protein ABI612_10980 [Betaproteobacteria bacterium]